MRRITLIGIALLLAACSREEPAVEAPPEDMAEPFQVQVDRFADLEVLRYEVPGFEELSLKEKKLVYYLSQAALAGRDIIYDQNYEHNLRIRKLLARTSGRCSNTRNASGSRTVFITTTR